MKDTKSVETFIKNTDLRFIPLVKELRKIVLSGSPDIKETIKWGTPTYSYNGKNICSIMVHKEHMNFVFFEGAKLNCDKFVGDGKLLKRICIRTKGDIDTKQFSRLVADAIKLVV